MSRKAAEPTTEPPSTRPMSFPGQSQEGASGAVGPAGGDVIDGVIVDNSRELVDRLYRLLEIHGEHIAAFFEIMDEIHRTEAWRVEDCASFADFCKRRVMTSIPKSARPLLVVQFRELGWTLRETAAAVGASPATVLRDERAVGAQDAGAVSSETAGDDDAGHGEQLRGDGGPASP